VISEGISINSKLEAFLMQEAFMYFAIVESAYGLTILSLSMLSLEFPSILEASSTRISSIMLSFLILSGKTNAFFYSCVGLVNSYNS